jgi:hypothetical protein
MALDLLTGAALIYLYIVFHYPPALLQKSWVWSSFIGLSLAGICIYQPSISLSLSLILAIDYYYSSLLVADKSKKGFALVMMLLVVSGGYVLYSYSTSEYFGTDLIIDISKILSQMTKECTSLFGTT